MKKTSLKKIALGLMLALTLQVFGGINVYADDANTQPTLDIREIDETNVEMIYASPTRGTVTWPNEGTLGSGKTLRFTNTNGGNFPAPGSLGVTFKVTLSTAENNISLGYYLTQTQQYVYCSTTYVKSGSNYVYTATMYPSNYYHACLYNDTVSTVTIKSATLTDN